MNIPKKISEKVVSSNPYLKVSEKIYLDDFGNKSSFLITGHNKKKTIGTFVLPITSDNKVIYLKEYRYGPEKYVINFPVGMLEDDISEIENCKSELKEETGYTSEKIEFLGESIVENYFEGKVTYYMAYNCKKISEAKGEKGENIKVYTSTINEFEKMILDGKVLSSKTAFCFLLAQKKGLLSNL